MQTERARCKEMIQNALDLHRQAQTEQEKDLATELLETAKSTTVTLCGAVILNEIMSEIQEDAQPEPDQERMSAICVSISNADKLRLQSYARKHGATVSGIIRLWIQRYTEE